MLKYQLRHYAINAWYKAIKTVFSNKRKIEAFIFNIVEWYQAYGDQRLPWRNTSDPWNLLIAAFLLRKTSTAQVVRIYERFIERFPTPDALLSVPENEVKELIRPLGIEHHRARLLRELAKYIIKRYNGKIPCSREELKKLPGVGEYIASEVLLVACGEPEPLLDRNMIRVIERVFGLKSSRKRPHMDPEMWNFAKILVPTDPKMAKAFNYGVLDLARKICTARKPKCDKCPIASICNYYELVKKS